jgi:hypothetical protein
MKWVGHVIRIGEERNAYRVLMGKPKRKGLLGSPIYRQNNNITINLREIGWGGMGWIFCLWIGTIRGLL